MTGMSLVEFLQARLDEEAALAERLAQRYIYPPDHDLAGQSYWPSPMVRAALQTKGDEDAAALIGTFNPHRVLAEVEAKRRIIDEHFGFLHPAGNPDRACRRCSDLRADDDPLIRMDRWLKLEPSPCTTLRLLALPFASHPDYRDEWKP